MTYRLRFHALALTEWRKLDNSVREPLRKKLMERLSNPRVPSAALSGMADCYKIKRRGLGYRLVYRVDEALVYVTVIHRGRATGQEPGLHRRQDTISGMTRESVADPDAGALPSSRPHPQNRPNSEIPSIAAGSTSSEWRR